MYADGVEVEEKKYFQESKGDRDVKTVATRDLKHVASIERPDLTLTIKRL